MEKTIQTTVSFEHRVITQHVDKNGVVFNVGEVLERTKSTNKRKFYSKNGLQRGMLYADAGEIPAEKVGIFKIIRTVTEAEEFVW